MKKRWWIKYLVLVVIALVSCWASIGIIGGEGGVFLLLLYFLPVAGFLAHIFIPIDIYRLEWFKRFNEKWWRIKYIIILIPLSGIYLAGWNDIPLDNRSFLFGRTIWFGKMIASWKVLIVAPLLILTLICVSIVLCPGTIHGPYDYRITPSMKMLQDYANRTGQTINYSLTGKKVMHLGAELGMVKFLDSLMEFGASLTGKEPAFTRAMPEDYVGRYQFIDSGNTIETFGHIPHALEDTVKDSLVWLAKISALKINAPKLFL